MFGSKASLLDLGLNAFENRRWRHARRYFEDIEPMERRPVADYHLGLLYWRGLGGVRDPGAAVGCFRRAASTGHSAAQTALGLALSSGAGAPKDEAAARALFRSAAGAGDVAAMTQLARYVDPNEALSLLERAAETGYAEAMRSLSEMVLPMDPVEALTWLYISVLWNGDEIASRRARDLAEEMTADEISEAQRRGRTFVKRLKRGRAARH